MRATSGRPESFAYWLPSTAGQTLVTAFADGATAEPAKILVAGPPAIHGPSVSFERGIKYAATIRTSGKLDSCVLEEILPGTASVKFVNPKLGELSGEISLLEASDEFTCAAQKAFELELEFEATARDGAEGVLRCFDTFGQEGDFTFAVAADLGTGGEGGAPN